MVVVRSLRVAVALCILAGAGTRAGAETTAPVGLRYGDHPGFGRLVLDLGDRPAPKFVRQGDSLIVSVVAPLVMPANPSPPRNVRSVGASGTGLTVVLLPGTTVRSMMMDRRLVLDFVDAQAPSPQGAIVPKVKSRPGPIVQKSVEQAGVPKPAETPRDSIPPPAVVVAQSGSSAESNPVAPPRIVMADKAEVQADPPPGSLASAASLPAASQEGPGHSFVLPFDLQVGAAAFRRGGDAMVVFDVRSPIDLRALQNDPVFEQAEVRLLPNATVIRLQLPEQTELRLSRSEARWVVTAIGGDAVPPGLSPIAPGVVESGVRLPANAPGMVVSVPDPQTGGVILVGTQRQTGQRLATLRRSPDFVILPTWQGVAVAPVSDAVEMRIAVDGFVIGSGGEGRSLVAPAYGGADLGAADARVMTRLFDLPAETTDRLLRRLQSKVATAGAAPVQSRVEPRRQVAEAMIALGMGAEAMSVLELGIKDDARASDDPAIVALSAIGALLAGRDGAAGGLSDKRLDGSDEIELWRAVRAARQDPMSSTAADGFASTLPLLMSYPAALRDRLLPLAAETMAQAGSGEGLAKLLTRFGAGPMLDLARAMAMQSAGGDPATALTLYDQLANAPDRRVRVRAAEKAAELRFANGLANAAQTAEALDRLLLAWRDDTSDVDRRLRVADLMTASNQFRPALKVLREAEQAWPARKELIRSKLRSSFDAALAPTGQAALSAFDMVALAEDNADLIPDGDAGQVVAERVIDRLAELDLPEREEKLLDRLAQTVPSGVARATFGARLASARLQLNNPAGAIQALKDTTTDTMPQSVLETRTLAFAKAVAAQNDLPSAERALLDLDTEAGDRLMARLREDAKEWSGAVAAWTRVVTKIVPAEGALSENQAATLLRLAGAAVQAGDEAALERLRMLDKARMPPGKITDTFNLLIGRPIQGVGDLPRVAADTALMRAVPAALSAMAAIPGVRSVTP